MTSAKAPILQDGSSLSAPHQVTVTHLDWEVTVDFTQSIVSGTAMYTIQRVDPKATSLQLDTANLVIHKCSNGAGEALAYQEHKSSQEHLGTQLVINLKKDTSKVAIEYQTTLDSSALQWLPPAQTVGKVHPYLFTQCQAIHARSLVPCQDRPGVKMTYKARVTVPDWATCVMSAVLQDKKSDGAADTLCFVWEQKIPISSYLLAMAVGDLVKKDISPRCAVWSEPGIVDAAAWEFAQTEDFLKLAEELAGKPYAWGRYDLLCMPPSFPFGGMENPCFTYVTPTLLAGDRSLADVVAHEIAHSWTGNLVTNATWDHFWLNEGFTTWFQRKIMARIHKDDRFVDFDALGRFRELQDTVNGEMPEKFTKLVLDIGEEDPDDSYSLVSYEKGFNLLYFLEKRVGKEKFEDFFKAYIAKFASKILTSEDFKSFFMDYFKANTAVKGIDWQTWLYAPGMPPEEPNFDRTLAAQAEQLAEAWYAVDRQGTAVPDTDISGWSSDQKICFLDLLVGLVGSTPLKVSTVQAMHKQYGFAETKNSEILFRYATLAIEAEDESMLMVVLHFVTSQGRMKFTRPLYRALFASKWRQAAVTAFMGNKHCYHPICAKMVASDLQKIKPKNKGISSVSKWVAVAAVGAALAAMAALVLQRGSKR